MKTNETQTHEAPVTQPRDEQRASFLRRKASGVLAVSTGLKAGRAPEAERKQGG